MRATDQFYDSLAPFYHLLYPDWERGIRNQSTAIDEIIGRHWPGAKTILDVACGIGTQAIGLARLGYTVTGSDVSPGAIARATSEVDHRGLHIELSVADMRSVYDHHRKTFDAVISCDNAVPHLLTDREIFEAFRQFYHCVRPGGGCLISVRDYAKEDCTKRQLKPYGIRDTDGSRWIGWQIWDPQPPYYQVSLYLIEDRGDAGCETHVTRSVYNPVTISHLIGLLEQAGFMDVHRIDGVFFQPVIAATRRTD
jgi:SAM-dependent methyltransferase